MIRAEEKEGYKCDYSKMRKYSTKQTKEEKMLAEMGIFPNII